jgi:hypothetical protein
MLQGIESKKCEPCHLLSRSVYSEDAARLVQTSPRWHRKPFHILLSHPDYSPKKFKNQ